MIKIWWVFSHSLAAHGRSKQSLASLVQLGEDDVLGLVGRRLRREVDHDWLVRLLGQPVQYEILPNVDIQIGTHAFGLQLSTVVHYSTHMYSYTSDKMQFKLKPFLFVHTIYSLQWNLHMLLFQSQLGLA